MSQRQYAIIGTGAIGGYYGGRLQQAGFDVHFLLKSNYSVVKTQGLKIDSCDGDFTLPVVKAYNDPSQIPPCDVAVVALKATQNPILSEILPQILKADGLVLLLQNGLGTEETIANIVPNPIVGGLCFICSNKVAPDYIRHLEYGSIKMAQYCPDGGVAGITDDLKGLAADFQKAGIQVNLSEDLLLTRWEKLAWNIPFNGLSALLKATTTEIMENPQARSLAEALAGEVAEGAKANDRALSSEFISNLMARTAKMKPYNTSMKLDRDAKRPLEVEAIFGNPLRLAKEKGIELPRIETLYQQLKFLDQQNSQG